MAFLLTVNINRFLHLCFLGRASRASFHYNMHMEAALKRDQNENLENVIRVFISRTSENQRQMNSKNEVTNNTSNILMINCYPYNITNESIDSSHILCCFLFSRQKEIHTITLFHRKSLFIFICFLSYGSEIIYWTRMNHPTKIPFLSQLYFLAFAFSCSSSLSNSSAAFSAFSSGVNFGFFASSSFNFCAIICCSLALCSISCLFLII